MNHVGTGDNRTNHHERSRGSVSHDQSYPKDRTGDHISLNPNHWDDSIPFSGSLRDWADYHVACKIAHQWGQENRLIPYDSMPYFKSDIIDFVKTRESDHPPT